jgi:hypothetical protein
MVRAMFEYDSVSASAYDANSLVGKLNEKASDGWEVVSIVPTGGEVTAFLKRTASAGSDGQGTSTAEPEAAGVGAAAGIGAATAVSEPAGWAAEPETSSSDEATSTESAWGAGPAAGAGAAAGVAAAEEARSEPEPVATPEPLATSEPTPVPEPEPAAAAAAAAPAAAPAAASVPTTPAGWYPDPSGRFEMRYWDGDKWTEHVSRQGQTYTDPPVA